MADQKDFLPETFVSLYSRDELQKNRIHIKHIAALNDLVLLVAFEDKALNMNDVTFLINRIDGFHPRSDPDQFPVFLLANHPCISKWENEIGSAHPEPSEDEPEVTLDIEQELFEDLTRLCNVMEVSLPQLARAIFRFIADPETRDTANQWFGIRLQTPRDPAEPNHRSQI